MSHTRIPIVCLVLLALTASAFVATKFSTSQASQTDKPPLKMKVLRDKDNWRFGSVRFGGNLTRIRNLQNLPDEDYIAYRHVFAYIYSEEHGKEKPNQNVNTAVEFFKHSVPLSEDEANVLAKTALETETRTLAIEEQAATIIKRFRERIDAEFKSGRKASPEPQELQTLQKQRVRTTLQGRDELRKAFGESTFSRFDTFLKEGMNLRIEKVIPSR